MPHTGDSTVTELFLILKTCRKNVSPEVLLDAELDRDIQNWTKILGMGKQGSRHEKLKSRSPFFIAFYAHVRRVHFIFFLFNAVLACERGRPTYSGTGSTNQQAPQSCAGSSSTCDGNHECSTVGSFQYCCPSAGKTKMLSLSEHSGGR